jgi:2Fe-2S ferredoxin
MGKITFVSFDGTSHEADLVFGQSLMQIATDNGVPGIDGDCGGVCACGTCHVILDKQWLASLPTANSEEQQMLSMTPEKQDSSRLACQITASADMDGMTVQLPEFQM